MATARRRDEWDRTANVMSVVIRSMGGKWIDPQRFNPFVRKRQKSKQEKEVENREGWALLRAGLAQMSRR